jgi:hypothetical protein
MQNRSLVLHLKRKADIRKMFGIAFSRLSKYSHSSTHIAIMTGINHVSVK